MKIVFKIIQELLRIISGSFNFVLLIIKFKLFLYYSKEKKITKTISKLKLSKILVVSGGNSLLDNWSIISDYDFIALNSFYTFNKLSFEQQNELVQKLLIYYQAPYHKPIELDYYNECVQNIINRVNSNCINIFDSKCVYSRLPDVIKDSSFDFKVKFGMNYFGGKFVAGSGAFTLLDIIVQSGCKNIDIIGFDLDFYNTDTFISIDDLALSTFQNSIAYYELKKFKRKCEFFPNLSINNLNENSRYNLK